MKTRKAPAFLTQKTLSRRTFLRGTGVAMALPFLDAMRPRMAMAQGMGSSKFIGFYVPCGIHMDAWTPAQEGALQLSPILQPFAGLEPYLNVISGLDNEPARPDGAGDHAAGTGSFMTAAHCFKTEGANIRNGVSLDQLIAQQAGGDQRFASLVLASEGGGNAGGCDSGYSCAYSRNISWVDAQTPAARSTNPSSIFNRLFGTDSTGLTPEQAARKRRYRTSILDYVHDDARRLQAKLGPTDRQKLDQYLTSVRGLEQQIEQSSAHDCEPGVAPERPVDVRDHVRQMCDLMVLAFQCDLTSVISYMLGNGGSNRAYPFLDIPEGHHLLSHHQDNPANWAKLQTIDTWEMSQVAYLLNALRNQETATGNLLDETVVFVSSEIEDGNSHSHFNMPILVAGGAGGQLQGGRHLRFDRPVADLFMTLGRFCGARLDSFGDNSTGALNLG